MESSSTALAPVRLNFEQVQRRHYPSHSLTRSDYEIVSKGLHKYARAPRTRTVRSYSKKSTTAALSWNLFRHDEDSGDGKDGSSAVSPVNSQFFGDNNDLMEYLSEEELETIEMSPEFQALNCVSFVFGHSDIAAFLVVAS